jgi:predicted metal-binding membrane protein
MLSIRVQRNLILATLLVLATLAWGLLVWQATIWVAMMVAVMFPTAAPMVLVFGQVHASRGRREQPFVPTWAFVSAYLLVWALAGALAYVGALTAERLAAQSPWIVANAGRLGGLVLVVAGLYQLSPLKERCLEKCRSPLAFVTSSWREGYRGAFRMGLEHGLYCLGCCWLLFVILFPLGMLNIAALAALTLLIFAENALPLGQRVRQVVALTLIAYGLFAVALPQVLPTMHGVGQNSM